MCQLAAPGHWNFKRLIAAFAIAFLLQMLFLPCLCDIGRTKMIFALVFDLLVVVRGGFAYLSRERGSGWKFYAWVVGLSPLWIELAAYLVFGET